MLIQITNKCTLECPHCAQNSLPHERHMTVETFLKALQFGAWSGCLRYNISGGEPTEHPTFKDLMDILTSHIESNRIGFEFATFTIESNGEWIRDAKKVAIIKDILSSKWLELLQVTSVPGIYRNFDFIKKYRSRIENLSKKVFVFTGPLLRMDDLGRAHKNEKYLEQSKSKPYFPSCMNCSLVSHQVSDIHDLSTALFSSDNTCRPFIDWKGNVHMGESIFCHSVGNVNRDEFETIWQNMQSFKPCGRCHQYKVFMESKEPKSLAAKTILGLLTTDKEKEV